MIWLRVCVALMALSVGGAIASAPSLADVVMQDKFVFDDDSYAGFGEGGRSFALTSARDGAQQFATFLAVESGADPVGVEFSNAGDWGKFLRLWQSAKAARAAMLARQPAPDGPDLQYTDSSGANMSIMVLDVVDAPLSVLIEQKGGHRAMFQISAARMTDFEKAIAQISTRFPANVK